MFCGAGSFPHADDGPPSPTSIKKKQQSRSKNPYSTIGLDKFSKVVSQLDSKREQIIAMATDATSGVAPLVRFIYQSDTKKWIPLIVKMRQEVLPPQPQAKDKKPVPVPEAVKEKQVVERKKGVTWGDMHGWGRWRNGYSWMVVLLVVLVCLVFGRVFAICCTSVCWYLLPNMKGECGRGGKRRSAMKKNVGVVPGGGRNLTVDDSGQEMSSPRSNVNGKRG